MKEKCCLLFNFLSFFFFLFFFLFSFFSFFSSFLRFPYCHSFFHSIPLQISSFLSTSFITGNHRSLVYYYFLCFPFFVPFICDYLFLSFVHSFIQTFVTFLCGIILIFFVPRLTHFPFIILFISFSFSFFPSFFIVSSFCYCFFLSIF